MKKTLAPKFDAAAKAYCATGGPKCVPMRLVVVLWTVEPTDEPGTCKFTITVEVNCGEPGMPTWRIILDAVADTFKIVLEVVLAVSLAVEIGTALLAKLATDPNTLEQVKEFAEELVKMGH